MNGTIRDSLPLSFWRRAARARRRLLMLDYDGTLAPFRVSRMEARPLPGVLRWIEKGARSGRTAFAIVSGRPLAEPTSCSPGYPRISSASTGGRSASARALSSSTRSRMEQRRLSSARPRPPSGRGSPSGSRGSARLSCSMCAVFRARRGSNSNASSSGSEARAASPMPLFSRRRTAVSSFEPSGATREPRFASLSRSRLPALSPSTSATTRRTRMRFGSCGMVASAFGWNGGTRRATEASLHLRSCARVRAFLARWAEEVEGSTP